VTSRVLSILLVCAYIPMYDSYGRREVVTVLCSCALPLICIWFSEPVADITGGLVRPSPPFLVWLFGWITLLMPLVLWLTALYVFG
jgi:hypothetical protein